MSKNAITNDDVSMCSELTDILGSIKGAKRVESSYVLQFTIVVENEEGREAVNKVAAALCDQAEKRGMGLEIMAALESEIEEAKQRFAALNA